MPVHTSPYFFADALQADFLRDLTLASQAGRLTPLEQARLARCVQPSGSDGRPDVNWPYSPATALPTALAGALVIARAGSGVYLHTPLRGLETFPTRVALDQALQQRGGPTASALEPILTDTPLFTARMCALVTNRWQRLRIFHRHWQWLPTLATLDTASTELPEAEQALTDFWSDSPGAGPTRRQVLAGLLADAWDSAIVQAVHDGLLSRNDAESLHGAIGRHQAQRLALSAGPGEPIRLAGAWVVQGAADAPLYLYWPGLALQRFSAHAGLLAWLGHADQHARVAGSVALGDRAALPGSGQWQLRLDSVDGDLPLERADALIGLQQRNLAFAHGQAGATPASLAAALDMRQLIDPSLVRFDGPASASPVDTQPRIDAGPQERVQALCTRLQHLDGRANRVMACAESLLGAYLASIDEYPPAEQIGRLSSALLQRLTGHLPAPANGPALRLSRVPAALVDFMLAQAASILPAEYIRSLDAALADNQPLVAQLRKAALGLELDYQIGLARLGNEPLDWLRQVLNHPSRDGRLTLGAALCEVHCLAFHEGRGQPSSVFTNAFVVHPQAAPAGPVLFWSAIEGVELFPSLAALLGTIHQRLRGERAWCWLNLLPADVRESLVGRLDSPTPPLQLVTAEVVEDFAQYFERLQRLYLLAEADAVWRRGVASRLPQPAFAQYLAQAAEHGALADRLQAQVIETTGLALFKTLPDWLREASPADRAHYAEALAGVARATRQKDFRFGIPTLHEYAKAQLLSRLRGLQPDHPADPDRIRITLTQYVSAPVSPGQLPLAIAAVALRQTDSLTAYALTHFARTVDAHLQIAMADASAVPPGLTAQRVRQWVHELDIGSHYTSLLRAKMAIGAPQYLERRCLFARQAPAQLLEAAWQARLGGQLSHAAFDLVQSLLDMPDGLARQSLKGDATLLRPLGLIAQAGMAPDRAMGLCLIGPPHGPVVLYAAGHPGFVFKAFSSDAELLAAAQQPGELQTLLVGRIDAQVRNRYARGGMIEPHLPYSDQSSFDMIWLRHPAPTLATSPYPGNAWHLLYDDCVDLLIELAKAQSVTSSEQDWDSGKFLIGLAIEQGLVLLPGRIGVLVGLWQGLQLADQARQAALGGQWGEAFAELATALAVLAGARVPEAHHDNAADYLASEPLLRDELRPFETQQALAELTYDATHHLYGQGEHRYAAVMGKAYQVEQRSGRWGIVEGPRQGPAVTREAGGPWRIEPLWDLRFGGLGSRPVRRSSSASSIGTYLEVKARGMLEIRATYRDKARRIGQAHAYARQRLEIAMDNLGVLRPTRPLHPDISALLSKQFSAAPTPALTERVLTAMSDLLGALQDPSLSPWNSSRYVYAVRHPGITEQIVALVAKDDPARQIFFTEIFFDLPARIRRLHGRLLTPFDLPAHARASALIHELSHLVSDTEDIAYLEPGAPYPDLIDPADPLDPTFKAELIELQDNRLSLSTPRDRLFHRKVGPDWVALDSVDNAASERVLTLTERASLDEARDDFYTDADKRAAIILANADSLAMLAMLLGRERLPPQA
jgi:hypothetical protein